MTTPNTIKTNGKKRTGKVRLVQGTPVECVASDGTEYTINLRRVRNA